MRMLERDKKPFWYANYIGREMLTEGQYVTGERSTAYDDPAQAFGTFSENVGAATPRDFGTYIDYDYTIHMDQGACPFDENAAIWLPGTDPTGEHDAKVTRISDSASHTAIAVKKVR